MTPSSVVDLPFRTLSRTGNLSLEFGVGSVKHTLAVPTSTATTREAHVALLNVKEASVLLT